MINPNIYHTQPGIPVPQWAKHMIRHLCEEYDMPTPTIHWMESDASGETGGWYAHGLNEIYIVANGNRTVDAHSLAHEFAHYITDEGHGSAMYAALLDITDRFEMDFGYMARVEADYQPKAIIDGLIKRGY